MISKWPEYTEARAFAKEERDIEILKEQGTLFKEKAVFGFIQCNNKSHNLDFLGDAVDKNLPANAGNMGSIPDPG